MVKYEKSGMDFSVNIGLMSAFSVEESRELKREFSHCVFFSFFLKTSKSLRVLLVSTVLSRLKHLDPLMFYKSLCTLRKKNG